MRTESCTIPDFGHGPLRTPSLLRLCLRRRQGELLLVNSALDTVGAIFLRCAELVGVLAVSGLMCAPLLLLPLWVPLTFAIAGGTLIAGLWTWTRLRTIKFAIRAIRRELVWIRLDAARRCVELAGSSVDVEVTRMRVIDRRAPMTRRGFETCWVLDDSAGASYVLWYTNSPYCANGEVIETWAKAAGVLREHLSCEVSDEVEWPLGERDS